MAFLHQSIRLKVDKTNSDSINCASQSFNECYFISISDIGCIQWDDEKSVSDNLLNLDIMHLFLYSICSL